MSIKLCLRAAAGVLLAAGLWPAAAAQAGAAAPGDLLARYQAAQTARADMARLRALCEGADAPTPAALAALTQSQLEAASRQFEAAEQACDALPEANRRLAVARQALAQQLVAATQPVPDRVVAVAQAAGQAQGAADKVRAQAEKAFDLSDTVAGKALAAYAQAASAPGGLTPADKAWLKPTLKAADESAQQARKAYTASLGIQRLANDAVQPTLRLAQCHVSGGCDPAAVARDLAEAEAASAKVKAAAEQSKGALDASKTAALLGDVGLLKITDPEARERAVAYLTFLDKNPDARSSFGGNAVKFSAGTGDGRVSIRLNTGPLWGWQRVSDASLVLSAPAADKGASRLYGSTDKLANSARLTFAANLRDFSSLQSDGKAASLLITSGLKLELGYERFDHYPADGASTTATNAAVKPWAAGVQTLVTSLDSDGKARATHQFGIDYQRSWKAAKTASFCKLASLGGALLTCTTGAFAPPTSDRGGLLSYQYRREVDWLGGMGIAPRLVYATDTHNREAELPLYFIRSAGDEPRLVSGVAYKWASTAGDGASHQITRQWSLFVTAPFSLFGR